MGGLVLETVTFTPTWALLPLSLFYTFIKHLLGPEYFLYVVYFDLPHLHWFCTYQIGCSLVFTLFEVILDPWKL